MATTLNRFRALIENSPDAIFLVNARTEILYASPSTAKVLGYQPEELLGRNGLELVHPQDREQSTQALQQVIEKPESSLQLNARVRRKDGEWCWVESTASNLLHEPDVNAIVLNAREIGARRAAEEEKRRYSEELARSNAELQTFAQNVAHDLREPMRTISAFTQLLIRRLQLSPDNRQFADCIVDGVGRMTKLLEDLLASASYGSRGNFEHLEMELAARQAVQNLSEAISTTGALITLEPLPAVLANESDLIRLFQNLISNAVKYHSTAPVEIRISAEELGPDWVIKIRDNGIGILREHHHRVFGLFTRLDNHQVPGAGIGLAVCKKIVEEQGGTIWVESEPGEGSTFCFSWHSARNSDVGERSESACVGASELSPKKKDLG